MNDALTELQRLAGRKGAESAEITPTQPICPVCGNPIEPDDEAPCKHCDKDVHEGCLAMFGICFSCAGEEPPERGKLNVTKD